MNPRDVLSHRHYYHTVNVQFNGINIGSRTYRVQSKEEAVQKTLDYLKLEFMLPID